MRRARVRPDRAAGATGDVGPLVRAARRARRYARARYSGFAVGAALETPAGDVITGCNIENASYGLTMCAERVALFAALAAGHRRFRRLAVATRADAPTPPCGACRQVLWEFAPGLEIVLAGRRGAPRHVQLRDLLPLPFGDDNLRARADARRRRGRRRVSA